MHKCTLYSAILRREKTCALIPTDHCAPHNNTTSYTLQPIILSSLSPTPQTSLTRNSNSNFPSTPYYPASHPDHFSHPYIPATPTTPAPSSHSPSPPSPPKARQAKYPPPQRTQPTSTPSLPPSPSKALNPIAFRNCEQTDLQQLSAIDVPQ